MKTIEESIAGSPGGSYVYDYDGAARLKSATYPTGLGLPEMSPYPFPYDDAGNRDDDPVAEDRKDEPAFCSRPSRDLMSIPLRGPAAGRCRGGTASASVPTSPSERCNRSSTSTAPANLMGMARFVAVRNAGLAGHRSTTAITLDDDEKIPGDFFANLVERSGPDKVVGWWACRIHGSYWQRTELREDRAEAD